MNASQLIKYQIISHAIDLHDQHFIGVLAANFENIFAETDTKEQVLEKLTVDNIDTVFSELEYDDAMQDSRYEVRGMGDEINLKPTGWSRHFEIDAVALKIKDQWVGWNYYYGGGKHGEPEEIDWISDARLLNCEEKEVLRIERTFSIPNATQSAEDL